ncbi:hypothetical protein [Pedobacter hartonius]|uniref:Uncharacterized protein n=1 Tax=Pedobacter hartonius TaxID=425514 RepID=A0A1H4GZS2_9SPHI|nr:hypothetical protein [Pedobacter hartonius]SEB14408.1 hypothetical protein SAMN05443550_11222 [Pedobacter hartonius]
MKYAFTFLCCLLALFVRAQNMELSRLKSFIERPAAKVTDSLRKAGWSLHAELSGVKGAQMYQTWSFGKHKAEKAKALAWFRLHADKGFINQLYYQSPGITQYNVLLKEIKETGTERKDVQSIENKKLSTYYVSPDYIFQTIVGMDSYTVMVMANKAQ